MTTPWMRGAPATQYSPAITTPNQNMLSSVSQWGTPAPPPGQITTPTVNLGMKADGTAPTWFDNFAGYGNAAGNNVAGWGGAGLSAITGAATAFVGWEQMKTAKEQLKEQKKWANIDYQAQRKMVNSSREDRQRARVASNPGAYESVSGHMNKFAV